MRRLRRRQCEVGQTGWQS